MVKKATKRVTTRKSNISGVPRTSWEAKRVGHPKADVNYDNLSEAEKKKWITIKSATAFSKAISDELGPERRLEHTLFVALTQIPDNMTIATPFLDENAVFENGV